MWMPLKKTELDFKGMTESEIIKENMKMIKTASESAGKKFTGKQLRRMAKLAYKASLKEKIYANDIYQVNVDDFSHEHFIHLSIKRNDRERIGQGRWQHFQWIKNQLCGKESEGVELYPAESRTVNTANQYHIWVLKNKQTFPVGWYGVRAVGSASPNGGKQTLETKKGGKDA